MADTLTLDVVTPERQVVHETVSEVQLPGRDGYLGILPMHTPLLTEIGIGSLSYKQGGATRYVAVNGGFAEVLPDRVTVLAEAAERAEEIDVPRAQKALAEAEKKLAAGASDPNTDWESLQQAIRRATVRLEVAQHAGAAAANSHA